MLGLHRSWTSSTLNGCARHAKVQGEAKEVLDAAMAEVDKVVPAGVKPLSVLCTGYCTGGALAAVAVARLALKFPQADTTCITFGSPL